MSGRKAAGLALSLGWAVWLCVAGAVVGYAAEGSESAGAEAAQAEGAEPPESAPVAESEDEKALLERARAYWDARVATSSQVYEFYPPDVQERGPLPGEFVGVLYKDYEIERVLTKGESGVVIVRTQQTLSPALAAQVKRADFEQFLKARVGEEWLRVDGTWYKKPTYGGLSRFMHSRRGEQPAPAENAVPEGAAGEVPGSAAP